MESVAGIVGSGCAWGFVVCVGSIVCWVGIGGMLWQRLCGDKLLSYQTVLPHSMDIDW